jgi:glycerate dehydrogenase
MSALFLDYETVSDGDLDTAVLTRVVPDLRFFDSTAPGEIADRIADANIILVNKCRLPRECLQAAPRLRLIALAATGTDNVDLDAARELGIAVCNVSGYCTASVVQHVWGMILALTHHLLEYRALATGGAWRRGLQFTMLDHPFRELAGRRLGIVGYGTLGRGVAQAAQAFGMHVDIANRAGADPRPGRLDLADLLRVADVVSLHCPLSAATRGLIGARELALMKPDALLINTARGALIDGRALADALRAGRIGGAGIDVLPQEPPADGDPLLDPDIPNLLLTPHIAWAAREARQRCLEEMAANIRDFLGGKRRGRVD